MEKLAIGRLTLYAGKDGRCYPSHETLARELCLKRRQLIGVLHSLQRKGRLDWTRTGKSNSYRFPDVQAVAHLTGGMCRRLHNRCAVNRTTDVQWNAHKEKL